MDSSDHLPIYTSSGEQTRTTSPSTDNVSVSASDNAISSSEVQLLLSMVNTLVDNRLSSVLPSAFTNTSNTAQLPSNLHPDVLSMFQQSLQNNLLQQHPPPPSAAPVSSTPTLFSAIALHNAHTAVTPGINNGNLTAGVNNLYPNLANQQQQHLQQQLNSSQSVQAQSDFQLPAVPAKILKQIKNGEFVDFDLLLPSNIGRPTNSTVSLAFDGDGNISLQKNDSSGQQLTKKAKVIDLNSWFMAWSRYFQASLVYRPHLVHQLVFYQMYIAHLANDYSFFGWYTYDKAFRIFIANNPTARWDVSNISLYNMHLRGHREPSQCYLCQSKDHLASRCPSFAFPARPSVNQGYTSQLAQQVTPSSRLPSHPGPRPRPPSLPRTRYFQPYPSLRQPFPAPQQAASAAASTKHCHNFNNNNQCRPSCRFLHSCLICNYPHPVVQCPYRP